MKEAKYFPAQILVVFNEGVDKERIARVLTQFGLFMVASNSKSKRTFIHVPVGSEKYWVEVFNGIPEVKRAQLSYIRHTC